MTSVKAKLGEVRDTANRCCSLSCSALSLVHQTLLLLQGPDAPPAEVESLRGQLARYRKALEDAHYAARRSFVEPLRAIVEAGERPHIALEVGTTVCRTYVDASIALATQLARRLSSLDGLAAKGPGGDTIKVYRRLLSIWPVPDIDDEKAALCIGLQLNRLRLGLDRELEDAFLRCETGSVYAGDGPIKPGDWTEGGRVYDGMNEKAWLMVHYLWQQRGHCCSWQDLAMPVYGDAAYPIGGECVPSLRKKANKFFNDNNLPWRVTAAVNSRSSDNEIVRLLPR